ncbi:ABC transporter ATP-binding protein [Micromonospora yangpuensis]|uniref:NitT/TauT family transport system ATP-binding protein n=1 Tax=Micromonospora yangpuensis TaxID=683228 RepID=A0A1C6UQY8_9ACTN|nr:ABC transporter ATP-binding protein [Micromonospora yangpuensis]GGM07297.1 ABC transporter [Micromonospora yangpuensis]SCL56447.1 NitT/TauT family transport system ATP-binding protein [Micromonospora yangpuensis]
MTAAGPLLRVDRLRKVYPSSTRPVVAVDGLTLDVAAGEFVCVVGPSGGGKSTLLKMVSGLLPPTAGQVLLDGVAVTGPVPGLAVVFQEYGRSLYPWKTVRDNVALPLLPRRLSRAQRHRRAEAALTSVGLADAARAYPWQLSGGMQQRVAIARALVGEPRVLLMDEPFAAVDAQTRADLEDLVRALWQRLGITVLFVTHDIDESVYLGERVLVLSRAPATIRADLTVDLPTERDQPTTRADARFAALRSEVFRLVAAESVPEPGEPR